MVLYVAFVLSLFVPHLSFFEYLRRAVLCVCDICDMWVSPLVFFRSPLSPMTKHEFVIWSCIRIKGELLRK